MPATAVLLVGAALVVFTFYILLKPNTHAKSSLPLPPGPKPLPVIGNLHQAPTRDSWLTFAAWTRQYGPIYHLNFGGTTLIMLNTSSAASDLLEKRGQNYSSRPHIPMMGDCLSRGYIYVLQPWGEKFRTHQRIVTSFLNPSIAAKYARIQEFESLQLMYDLLAPHADFLEAFERYACSVIYTLAFGKRLLERHDPDRARLRQVIENLLAAGAQGAWIVDLIPVLNKLPRFLAPWKRTGDRWHAYEVDVHSSNMKHALQRPGWNWTKATMSHPSAEALPSLDHAFAVGALYEAGTETTSSLLDFLVTAAVLWPERLQKARDEVESVCGPNKLPAMQDMTQLRQVDAVVKEMLRMRPTLPNGMPRVVAQEDEYMGYRIPAGATVIAHSWSITHDPDIFSRPDEFLPDRWISNPDLPQNFFGFGRRLCPGKHLGFNNLLLLTARLLWAFDFSHTVDEKTGKRIEIDPDAMTQGLNPRQVPFKADITVRDEVRRKIIVGEFEKGEKEDIAVLLDEVKGGG